VFEEDMVPDRCQNAGRSKQKQVNRKGRVSMRIHN
jgi:hypothetical protein